MNQNALVLNEDVGLTNFIVHQQNEQDKANLLLISQMARAMKTPKVKKPARMRMPFRTSCKRCRTAPAGIEGWQ